MRAGGHFSYFIVQLIALLEQSDCSVRVCRFEIPIMNFYAGVFRSMRAVTINYELTWPGLIYHLAWRFKGAASAIIRIWHLLHTTASAISSYNALWSEHYKLMLHWLWFAQYHKCRWPRPLRHHTD